MPEATTTPLVPPVEHLEGFPPALQRLVDGYKAQMGFVASSFGAYLHRPEIAEAVLNFNVVLGKHPSSTLDRGLKRKIAFICSALNGCPYCTAHQCSYLTKAPGQDAEAWGLTGEDLQALLDGSARPESEMERAALDFARAASIDSSSVPEELRSRLRQHLTPPQIVELAFVVGHWKLFNTVNDSLGLAIEPVNAAHTGWVERAGAMAMDAPLR